jgi:Bacterial type II and III secretion system protein
MRFLISLGLALCVCVLGVSPLGYGQEVNSEEWPIATSVPAQSPPHPVAFAGDPILTRADHLLDAANHLAAAGLREDAEKYRQMAATERPSPVNPRAILVHLKLIEASTAKLKQLGLDPLRTPCGPEMGAKAGTALSADTRMPSAVLPPQASPGLQLVEDGSPLLDALETLRTEGGVRILSQPTLVTVSGRPANLHAGGSIPVPPAKPDEAKPTEWVEYGTRVQIVPVILADQRLHLDLRFTKSDLDQDATKKAGGRPAIRTLGVTSGLEMKSGQTAVLSGLHQSEASGKEGETTAMLLLVTAEIVEPPFGGNTPAVSRLPDGQTPRPAAPSGVTR